MKEFPDEPLTLNPDDDDENQPNAERDVNPFKEAKDRQIRAKKMVSDIKE